jgi:hypothetical protein
LLRNKKASWSLERNSIVTKRHVTAAKKMRRTIIRGKEEEEEAKMWVINRV